MNDSQLIWEAYLQESLGVDRAAQAALQEYADYKKRYKVESDAMYDRTKRDPEAAPDPGRVERQRAESEAIGNKLVAELELNLKKIIAEMPIDPEREDHQPARDLWVALDDAAANLEGAVDNEIQQFARMLGLNDGHIERLATRIGNFGNWQGN